MTSKKNKTNVYFCDSLLPEDVPCEKILEICMDNLSARKQRNKIGRRDHNLMWNELLDEEVWEATLAMAEHRYDDALDHLAKARGVLTLTEDVINGKQPLGDPDAPKKKTRKGRK